ncbi:hypothetical protein BDR07DRAFT_1426837 [Suillus spraguei]|nr:hypothetical protein BDR07DRAFT_1426837 [Suillus spraguei]
MTSLGGDDSHYRKIVRKAYVSCGARPPAIYKRKTREKTPIAKHVPAIPQPAEKVFPTLAQATAAVLARKAKQGSEATVEISVQAPQVTAQISYDVLALALPIQKLSPELDRGAHKSPMTRLRGAPQQSSSLKIDHKTVDVRSQPSILHPVAEERGRANGGNAPLPQKLDRHATPRPLRPVLLDTTAAICPPSSLRGSTSFAGWDSPAERRDRASEGESLKEVFAQLEDIRAWIEG